ncbi:MAG: pitrilysin family protein [Candidatus Eisenbacteria bacterium]|nr:pitrilysin family protein [Candidatus Eisenbacteria bacterium]
MSLLRQGRESARKSFGRPSFLLLPHAGVLFVLLFLFSSFSSCFSLPGSPVELHKLDNGLTIILKEDHSRGLIALCGYVLGGARTEPPPLSGLSHYYEHLIFRGGTEKQAELETRKKFQALGTFFGYTFEDGTCYYIIVPKENLDEGLSRYVDAVMNLKPTHEKVERERQIVLEEFNQSINDNPRGLMGYRLQKTAFRVHPYGQTTIGSEDVVRTATLPTFRTFYEERYVPNQMVISAVGDFDSKEMLAKLTRAFGSYPRGKDSFELGNVEPEQNEFREVVTEMKTQESYLLLGFHIPEAGSEEAPFFDLLQQILTEGKSSRLIGALKEKESIVTSIYSYHDSFRDPGLFYIGCDLNPGQEERAVSVIFRELSLLARDGVAEDELSRVKRSVETSYAFGCETFFQQAERLCFYYATSSVDLEGMYLQRIRGAREEDINSLVRKYFGPANCTLSLVRPEAKERISFKGTVSGFNSQFAVPQAEVPVSQQAQKTELQNGMTVITKENKGASTVAMSFMIRGGLRAEPGERAGIANVTSRLLLRGTAVLTASEIAEKFDSLGVRVSTSSDRDFTEVSLEGTSSNFYPGFELLSAVLLEPVFPPQEIEKTKKEVVSEIRGLEDDSYELTHKGFAKVLYGSSPYGRTVLGDEAAVSSLSREEISEFYRRIFVPQNIVISVAGDINGEYVNKLILDKFGGLKKGTGPSFAKQEPGRAVRKTVNITKDKEQVTMNLGVPGPAAQDPDYVSLQIALRAIGSRLFFRLIYEEGLAYRMWTYLRPSFAGSPVTFELGVSGINFEKGRDTILEEIRGALDKGLGSDEIEVAKADATQRFLLSLQTNGETARALSLYETIGAGFKFAEDFPSMVKKTTAAQVTASARKYLPREDYALVTVGKIKE